MATQRTAEERLERKKHPPIGDGPILDANGDIPDEELDEQDATPELIETLGFNPDTEDYSDAEAYLDDLGLAD